jgi:4-amino-4-deoxy-L-arabinose transferase-like glycosyltransferase
MEKVGVSLYVGAGIPFVLALLFAYYLRKKGLTPLLVMLSISDRMLWVGLVVASLVSAAVFQFIEFKHTEIVMAHLDGYYARALNLVRYGVFGYGDYSTAFFPPGYSFLLVPAIYLLGNTKWAFFLTNLLLLLLSSLLFRKILLRLDVPRGLTNLLTLVLVLYPNRLISTFLPHSDVPFSLTYMLALMSVLMYAADPKKTLYLLVAGLTAGVGALIRTSGLILFVPIAVAALLSPPRPPTVSIARLAILCAGFLLVIAPWIWRNANTYGKLVPISTNGGYNMLMGTNPDTIYWNSYPDSKIAEVSGQAWDEVRKDSFWTATAMSRVTNDPVSSFTRGCRKVVRSFGADTWCIAAVAGDTNADRTPVWIIALLFVISNFLYYSLIGLSPYAVSLKWEQFSHIKFVMALVLVLVSCSIAVTFSMWRYKEPMNSIMPLAIGLSMISNSRQFRRQSQTGSASASAE